VNTLSDLADRSDTSSSFPVGGGELGGLIRDFDWSKTSLGPIEAWPQSLKTATDIVLQSPLPLVMLWGPGGVMIYNDAYSVFAGERHPRLLGSKVLEGWAEVADFNARVMEVGLAGGTLSFKDQELTLYRNNLPEKVWMDLNYGPVLDESGRPGGVLAIVVETTGQVQAQRRQSFLLELGERLRDLTDRREILTTVSAMLGRRLGADRAGWADIEIGTGRMVIETDWTAPDAPSLAGVSSLKDFGAALTASLASGETVRADDVVSSPLTEDPGVRATLAQARIGAFVSVPLLRGQSSIGVLFVHTTGPRHWSDSEVAFIQDVAERVWAALQRAQAESNVRKSESRFRALVNATADVVYRMSPDWKEMRALDGRGFIADTDSPSVAWMDEYVFPDDQAEVAAAIDKALANRSVFQLEHRVRRVDGSVGWTLSRGVPILDARGEITEWFGAASDVTARREAEEHLRLVINELNHRVKNNLAMIQAIAAQTFRNVDDLANARASFSARVVALARANDLLTEEHWVDASLKEIVESVLRPYFTVGSSRCAVSGPPVRLSAKTALSLAMACHELCTNAVKYGAWSNESGRVEVSWSVGADSAGRRLRLEWRERGGPPVAAPQRRGFGSTLIERGLAAELEGEVQLLFEPAGLVCRIDAPLNLRGDRLV
jgi:two-component sensor histidine kinase